MSRNNIAIFVSSTFADMERERDTLLTRTLPELRRRTAGLGRSLSEIDLRWGITEEAIASGRLLDTCLEQVEAARPFFVAIIGNRYGTVVGEISRTQLERWPWLDRLRGRSLTEIEIHLGTFLEPNPNALFYCKRSASTAPENPNVRRLIAEIEGRGYKPRHFDDAVHLDHLLHADLWRLIKAFDATSRPAVDNAFLRPRVWHDAVVAGLSPALEATDAIAEQICSRLSKSGSAVALVSDDEVERAATISALHRCERMVAAYPNRVCYVPSCTPIHTNPHIMLRQLLTHFAIEFDHHFQPSREAMGTLEYGINVVQLMDGDAGSRTLEIPSFDGVGRLADVFHEFLASLPEHPVLIVLDGIDTFWGEDPRRMLPDPSQIPPNIKLVVGLRRGAASCRAIETGYTLMDMDRLDDDTVEEFSRAYLTRYGKSLGKAMKKRLRSDDKLRDGLFLRLFLQELRLATRQDQLEQRACELLGVNGVSELIGRSMSSAREDLSEPERVLFDVLLILLTVARSGIRHSQLLAEAELQSRHTTAATTLGAVRSALGEHLLETFESSYMHHTGSGFRPETTYRWASAYAMGAARTKLGMGAEELRKLHGRLATRYIGATDPRSRADLVYHLWQAGRLQRVARLLTQSSTIADIWGVDSEELLQYSIELEQRLGVCVPEEIERSYSGRGAKTMVPEAIIEYLHAMNRPEIADRLRHRFEVAEKGRHRPFSWGAMATADHLVESPGDGLIEIGFHLDEVDHYEKTRNLFGAARARARLARLKSRLGKNEEALENFDQCLEKLDELSQSAGKYGADAVAFVEDERRFCEQGRADCVILMT